MGKKKWKVGSVAPRRRGHFVPSISVRVLVPRKSFQVASNYSNPPSLSLILSSHKVWYKAKEARRSVIPHYFLNTPHLPIYPCLQLFSLLWVVLDKQRWWSQRPPVTVEISFWTVPLLPDMCAIPSPSEWIFFFEHAFISSINSCRCREFVFSLVVAWNLKLDPWMN